MSNCATTRNYLDLWRPALALWFPVVAGTFVGALPLAIAIAVQRRDEVRVCSNPADLLIDILAQVGYVDDAAPIIEVRISQVFPQTLPARISRVAFR